MRTMAGATIGSVLVLAAARFFPRLIAALTQRPPDAVLLRDDARSPEALIAEVNSVPKELRRRLLVYRDPAVVHRIIGAYRYGLGPELIADAEVRQEAITVTTADLKTVVVPLAELPALRGRSPIELSEYEIDSDGSCIYWPQLDVHLGVEQFRLAVDPELREAARLATVRYNERYGAALRAVRRAHGLRQRDIAGLSERQVSRIEHGDRPRVATLEVLAAAHGLEINDYLREVAEALRSGDA